jgi:hypothetical protein
MTYGSPWSEDFIRDLSEKEFRNEFVSDQVRTRIAMLIRALREQSDRNWSQTELGSRMGKPQNVISRLEDPEYGKMTLQTLLEVAAAYDLPLWIDMPEWDDWLTKIRDVPKSGFKRISFDANSLIDNGHIAQTGSVSSDVRQLGKYSVTETPKVAQVIFFPPAARAKAA